MKKFSKFGGKNAVCKSKFNKFALSALIASSLVSSAAANWHDGVFVGVEGKYNLKSDFSTTLMEDFGGSIYYPNIKLDDNPFSLGLKIGYDLDFMRIYGAYNHNFEAKEKIEFYSVTYSAYYKNGFYPEELKYSTNDFLIGADWTPKFSLAGLDFKAILGAFAGISKIDVKYHGHYNTNPTNYNEIDYSQDGFIYGLKLGAIYDFDKFGEVEFGIKFDSAKYDDKDLKFTECYTVSGIPPYACSIRNGQASDTKRTSTGLFVGYNYKF